MSEPTTEADAPVEPELVDTERGGPLQKLQRATAAVVFAGMGMSVLAGVFWRLVLEEPLVWSVSIASLGFAWLIFFGTGLADWDDRHIQFDLVYRRLPRRWQRAARVLVNVMIVTAMVAVIPDTIDYLGFIGSRRLQGLPISLTFAYAPVVVFFGLTALLRSRLILMDIRQWVGERR